MADETPADKIQRHLRRFKLAYEAEKDQRQREQSDLAFQVPDKQWPEDVKAQRTSMTIGGVPIPARPMLSVAPVDEPIQLVSNQQRAASLAATFHPISEDADDDTAQILQGLYDQGANESNAAAARNWAYDRVLWCGTGWYRLDKEYDPDGGHPFDQKIVWRRIKNQGSVFTDPFCQWADKRDRRWQFITEDMPVDEYKRRWPDSRIAGYDDGELVTLGNEKPGWVGGDDEDSRTIRIAEVWEVTTTTRMHRLYDDGHVYADEDEIPDGVNVVEGDEARSRAEDVRTVVWSIINCQEFLEPEQEWDGQWIPLIPVIGRELQPFDGKERIVGMIANAKDAARLVNYAASGAVEMAALEPKAPWILDPRQIASYQSQWQQSNMRNFPWLPYDYLVDGQQYPKPERVQVDTSRLGPNMQILSMGGNMLQSAMSTFDPALGKQPTAHRSGRALEALQGQTQEANSHYLSNLAEITIPYEGLVWCDLAPHVYDRAGRSVRIHAGEGKTQLAMLKTHFRRHPKTGRPVPVPVAVGAPPPEDAQFVDLSRGRYSVSVTVGKSKASRLQEGADSLTSILQAEPALLTVIGPEWARFQDYPGSKKVAELLQKNRDHQMPWLAEQPQADQSQQIAQLQGQLQQVTQVAQQMKQALDTKQVEQQAKIQIEQISQETQIRLQQMKDATQIEVARINAAKEGMIAEREAAEERLATGLQVVAAAAKQELQTKHEATQAHLDRQHEAGMAGLQHAADTAASGREHQQALEQDQQANTFALQQAEAQRQAAEQAGSGPDAEQG